MQTRVVEKISKAALLEASDPLDSDVAKLLSNVWQCQVRGSGRVHRHCWGNAEVNVFEKRTLIIWENAIIYECLWLYDIYIHYIHTYTRYDMSYLNALILLYLCRQLDVYQFVGYFDILTICNPRVQNQIQTDDSMKVLASVCCALSQARQ